MSNVARWFIVGTLIASCVEQPPSRRGAPSVSPQEVEAIRRRVTSATAPTPTHRLDYNYGNKVTLLGYDMTPAEPHAGSNVSLTWYWHCDTATGDGWRLFTHLDDANGPRQNHDADGDVRRAYQPERWRQGEFIIDRQTFDVPADWDSPIIKVHVGLWKGDERMHVVHGQADHEGRALAITINTGTQVHVPDVDVPRVSAAINIDGHLDEPAWRTAGTSGPLVNPGSGAPAGVNDAHGSVRMLWDDQYLYLGWEIADDNLVETGTERDLHYWDNDTTETLLDPDGDGRNYYEIQVSPGGHTFDSQQPQPPSGNNFGNVAWNPNLRVAVVRNGTLNNESDVDVGYSVEMAIPWSDVSSGAAHVPPQVGDTWRANFFLMDKPKQGGMRHAAWSPPRSGNFHVPDRFGRLTFRAAAVMPGQFPPGMPGMPGMRPGVGAVPSVPMMRQGQQPPPAAAHPGAAPAPAPGTAPPPHAGGGH